MPTRLFLALLLALSACGDLPQPFFGNPGRTGAELSRPPPSRLAIPSPAQSLLPDAGAKAWASATAASLLEQEVPATHTDAHQGDWTLVLSAELRGPEVLPTYTVQNPSGQSEGASQGAPVPASAWASGDPQVLKTAADQAAPGIVQLLSRIEAAHLKSDPNSLMNRPARLYFTGVTGAPGDGNQSLPAQMTLKLADLGMVVQDSPDKADFKLRGEVKTAPGAGGTTRVEIQWIVDAPDGDERGRVLQLNEVPPGALDVHWSDVAVAVANEASGGVRDIILNATGLRGLHAATK